jgi:hypothetical protein
MSKKTIWALVLLGLTVIVILFNMKSVEVNLVFAKIDGMKSLVFFTFTSIGVVIGLLLGK